MIPILITEAFRYEVPHFAKYAIPYSVGLSMLEVTPRKTFEDFDLSLESCQKMFTYGFHFCTYMKDQYNHKELILLSNHELEQFAMLTYARMLLNVGGLASATVFVWVPFCIIRSSSEFKYQNLAYISFKLLWNTLSAAFIWGQFRAIRDFIRICRERKSRALIM